MDWYLYAAVVGIGIVAGFINTLAGSGSLLTLPFLMFLGLPANVANGTNRVAILLQNVVGVTRFKQKKVLDYKEGLWYGLPAAVGAIAGARIAVDVNEQLLRQVIGILLIVMFFLIILKPEKWLQEKNSKLSRGRKIILVFVFFLIGIYGGFIQAGVGFFLLAGLVAGAGVDLVRANALKVFTVLLYTPLALFIFMAHHQVDYVLGLVLAIGNMTGAFLGANVAVSWGPKFVRIILLLALFVSALKLTGAAEWLWSLIAG